MILNDFSLLCRYSITWAFMKGVRLKNGGLCEKDDPLSELCLNHLLASLRIPPFKTFSFEIQAYFLGLLHRPANS
jgi:hypothetical protein